MNLNGDKELKARIDFRLFIKLTINIVKNILIKGVQLSH